MPEVEKKEVQPIVETHREPGSPALEENQDQLLKETATETAAKETKETAKPTLPEGFSEERWNSLTSLEKQTEAFKPLMERLGVTSLEDLAYELSQQNGEGEDETATGPATQPAPGADPFMSAMKPEEQAWVNNFKSHLANDPQLGTKKIWSNLSDLTFDTWMNQMKMDMILESLGKLQGFETPKIDMSPREIRRVLETYGKTMIPKALKSGKNPAAEAYGFLLAQKPQQKPAVTNPSGIDKGLKTERPGGVPAESEALPWPRTPDGTDFAWDKMNEKQVAEALAWIAKNGGRPGG